MSFFINPNMHGENCDIAAFIHQASRLETIGLVLEMSGLSPAGKNTESNT